MTTRASFLTKGLSLLGRFARATWYRQLRFRWMRIGHNVIFAGPLECLGVTGKVTIGEGCYFGPWVSLSVAGGGAITVGAGTSINKGSVISSLAEVRIGRGCRIGENVSVRDNDHRIDGRVPIVSSGFVVEGVEIGNDVWIGRNATIRHGVKIGEGAVIGAHSLVNRDIPPFAIAVGTPARVVRIREA